MTKPTLGTYGGALHDAGYAGELVYINNPNTVISKINDQALAVQFGTAVARSAGDDTCKAPTSDSDKLICLALRFPVRPADASGNVYFSQYDEVPVLRGGFVYAIPAENVSRGDTVLSLTAGNGTLGGTTGGAAGTGRVALGNSTWETTTAAGSVAILRVAGV